MDRDSRPQPLSYKELSKGALYNAAQLTRQETRVPALHHDSLEHLRLHGVSHGSVADLSTGHLYNPTSSVHEVDPPTWPAYGMENVNSNTSPFKSFRLERPPSPVLGKRYALTYQGRGPSHHTVASGALYNPYVRTRLPPDVDTASARLLADSSVANLSRSTSNINPIYQPAPMAAVPLKEKLELSASGTGSAHKDDGDNYSMQQNKYYPPPGSHHPLGHLGTGGASRQPNIRSDASHARIENMQNANPNTAYGGPSMYIHPSQSQSRTDDPMYYHPSRENSIHHAVPAFRGEHNDYLGDAHLAGHAPSIGQGSFHHDTSRPLTTGRETPWMQQENVNAAAFESVHPSRTHSRTDESIYYHPSREHTPRGPSSLHHEYGDPTGSAHPSRAPSNHDGGSAYMVAVGASSNPHPSRASSVTQGSIVQEGWGDVVHPPDEHILSQEPTVNKGSIRAVDSIKNFKTSRTPSATTHVSRFQDQNMESHRENSRPISAASRASQIQRHMGGSRMGTPVQDMDLPSPIHEEGTQQQHFEQDRHMSPGGGNVHTIRASSIHHDTDALPARTPSAADDATSYHSRVPSAKGIPSRAPSALGEKGNQHTLTRRGRASRLGRGSGRATPVAAPDVSGSVYQISVVQASDDGKGTQESNT